MKNMDNETPKKTKAFATSPSLPLLRSATNFFGPPSKRIKSGIYTGKYERIFSSRSFMANNRLWESIHHLLFLSCISGVLQRQLLDGPTAANRKRLAKSLFQRHIREANSARLLAAQPIDFPAVHAKLIRFCSQRQFAPKAFIQRIRQEDHVEVPAVSLC